MLIMKNIDPHSKTLQRTFANQHFFPFFLYLPHFCSALFHFSVLHCLAVFFWYDDIWYDTMWYGIWYDTIYDIWYDMKWWYDDIYDIWYDMIDVMWCDVMLYDIYDRYDMIWYMIWCDITIIIIFYLLLLGCHPVAVVILHVYRIWNWLLINLSLEGYMRSM